MNAFRILNVQIIIFIISYVEGYRTVNSKVSLRNQTPLERCVIPGVLALTFDDGPGLQTLKVLDVLREKNVTATFFINGDNTMNIEDAMATVIVQKTMDEGHFVASHTWSHQNLTRLSYESILFEMNNLADTFFRLFGKRLTVMRPPFGNLNSTVIDIVAGQLSYDIIIWSIDPRDWDHPGDHAAGLVDYFKQINGTDPNTTLGFIALHHDPLAKSEEFAAIVIDYVRESGYRFVSLCECLGYPMS